MLAVQGLRPGPPVREVRLRQVGRPEGRTAAPRGVAMTGRLAGMMLPPMRYVLLLLSLALAFPAAAQNKLPAQKPSTTVPVKKEARFVSQPDGHLVDTHATPKGSYVQPSGGRTDILQREDHGAGLS